MAYYKYDIGNRVIFNKGFKVSSRVKNGKRIVGCTSGIIEDRHILCNIDNVKYNIYSIQDDDSNIIKLPESYIIDTTADVCNGDIVMYNNGKLYIFEKYISDDYTLKCIIRDKNCKSIKVSYNSIKKLYLI